jgi:membrane-bound lytic murein transglycosylase B
MPVSIREVSTLFACGGLLLCCIVRSDAQTPVDEVRAQRAELEKFIVYMADTHGFDARDLRALLGKIQPTEGVTRAMSAPSTAKPWYEFKPLFVDQGRVAGGIKFWNEHAELLARARNEFGVPEAIIAAVIGIETRYGRNTGNFRIVETLTTLGFYWPSRNEFFRGELEQFLLLAREQGWDAASIKGSFAGAMGQPQFMPGSYRRYAVDFDGDRRIDLWSNPADVIGSVGSYLQRFGWKAGEPVVAPARVDTADWRALLEIGLKPSLTVDQWRMRGVDSMQPLQESLPASLFSIDLLGGPEFWFGFENFYALLMYNRSRNYAMAVHELANEITRERERLAAIEGAR